jgi:hypothetical protein
MTNWRGPPLPPKPGGGHGCTKYERHDPEVPGLHRVVRENLATFYSAIEERWGPSPEASIRGFNLLPSSCSLL